ncbi:MAG: transcriptional regulator [Vibrio sp.]
MNQLHHWLNDVHQWYQNQNSEHVAMLQPLIFRVPEQIWNPKLSEKQSQAIACWLDACLRQFIYYRENDAEKGLQYLNLAYGRLQHCAAQPQCDIELKSWCMLRMQQLMVLSLECLNQQPDGQQQSASLIEAHVQFMAFHAWNDDQGNTSSQK